MSQDGGIPVDLTLIEARANGVLKGSTSRSAKLKVYS